VELVIILSVLNRPISTLLQNFSVKNSPSPNNNDTKGNHPVSVGTETPDTHLYLPD